MSDRIKTCCVFKCINTQSNSKVKFFNIPDPRLRPDQRTKWIDTIQDKNGQWWIPNAHSMICSEHFEKGHPSKVPQDTDYVPSVFITRRKVEKKKSPAVSLKRFAVEYMKHDALLERPSRSNNSTKRRKNAYLLLAQALAVPVSTTRLWERRFRRHFEEKLADPDHKWEPAADGTPHWKTIVEKRLYANPINRLSALGVGGAVSARGVVAALCAAARVRGTLCSTAMYQDVRRALHISSAINDLHAVWVSVQRVSLEQVVVAGRAGDAPPAAPPSAAQVADLVLLHTDVDMHRLVTDESVTLYEESSALHTLWQLVQQHQLEEAAHADERERARRWTRARWVYLACGRTASLLVLQRRWHELKLQARVRLAAHWRRAPAPSLVADLAPAPDPTSDFAPYPALDPAPDPALDIAPDSNLDPAGDPNLEPAPDIAPDSAPDPAPEALPPPPHEVYPRPAALHIAILKRYPHIATGPFKCWRELVLDGSIVIEPLEEENDIAVKQSQDSELSTATTVPGDNPAVAHLYPNMSDIDEPKEKQNSDSDTLSQEPTVKVAKVERSSIDDLAEQSTADDNFSEHPTDNKLMTELPLVNKFKEEATADNDLLGVQHTDSDLLTVGEYKVKQNTFIDRVVERSFLDAPVAESAAGLANIATCPNTPGRPADQIHRDENKSDEILPPERVNDSDTDTDTEDKLVIDECSNMTPCTLKREPAAHTETHSGDTVSPHAVLGNLAPTIEVLKMIDPSTVKTEILFESDEDDFQPCNELVQDEMELETKKKASFISNRIVFVDEVPGESCDDTNCMDYQNGQTMDDETTTFDPKLLMDTSVPLFRIDKTRAWRRNVRKDNSIRVSRIHRRYYTPKTKSKICNQNQSYIQEITVDKPCLEQNQSNIQEIRVDKTCVTQNQSKTQETRVDKSYLDQNQSKTQEIAVDKSCLEQVANNDSIRQLCRNIKREMIGQRLEMPEGNAIDKKAKAESDSEDDRNLLEIRKEKSGDTSDDTEDPDVGELVDESSSDDERLNEEMLNELRGRGPRWRPQGPRGRGCKRAASTIEWAAEYSPVFGRVAKRVSLPDIEQVRRLNSAMQVAQVAPITSATSAGGETMPMEQPPGDAADEDTPLAWRALDLPAQHELQAALDELTLASTGEQALGRRGRGGAHCCAARRQRDVNDTRRRLGLPDAKQHTHADGECTCCCAHLSDAAARVRLAAQLQALHHDIERLLWKAAEGRIHSKPKCSRSPSPAQASTSAAAVTAAHKQASTDSPSNTVTETKGSKATPATSTNRPKRRRPRSRAPPAPAPAPAPAPVDDYEEWQRQKNLNAQYFHINSNPSSKKDKSAARVSVIQSTTRQATPSTSQATAVPSASQATQLPSTSQDTAVASTNPQCVIQSTQTGLMPYIRESRLIAPVAAPPAPPALSELKPGPRPDAAPRPAELAQHNTVKQKPATTTECTKYHAVLPIRLPTLTPRPMNLTTEQVPAPPLSILEEYARTLAAAPAGSAPRLAALSLCAPASPQRTSTTIVMALTLPSERAVDETIDGANANGTVDLTEETDSSKSVITQSAQNTSTPLIDIVGAVKSLMNPADKRVGHRKLLKCLSNSARSLLKPKINSPSDKPPDAPAIMSQPKGLRDGDVIEIDDSDSNHSAGADGNQFSNSNESYIPVNNSSNPALHTSKSSNQAKSSNTKKSSDPTTNKADESLNQTVTTKSIEAVSQASPASKANGSAQAADESAATNSVPVKKVKKKRIRNRTDRYSKPSQLLKSNEDEVSEHATTRACSRIPELLALTSDRGRCAARRAAPAAMPAFMRQLRRAAERVHEEVYCYKWVAVGQAVSTLPCGGTLLCVDASRAPLVLPAHARAAARAPPHARAHLVLSDADLPCELPTYWTLWNYAQMTRVVPDETLAPLAPLAPDAKDKGQPPGARGPGDAFKDDPRPICEKKHNFKILTAFCSADGVRQAARAGATLLLLNVLRARICVLGVTRARAGGSVRHRASAHVEPELLQELEAMLDEAEVDEELGGRAEDANQ